MKPSPWAINCRRSGGAADLDLLTKPVEIFLGDKAGGSGRRGGGMIG